ncbi:NACHT domain-containing protein [Fusarium sp. Ph1]|nr:NACHT domain-containing protein [Fusarium sp. Ph1]
MPSNTTNILGMEEVDPSPSGLWGQARNFELLERLVPVAYDAQQAEFAQRRHPGTLQWFLDSDTYQKWIHAASDLDPDGQTQDLRTLFCPGLAGAGKTILTSAVIQDLGSRFPRGSDPNVGIAYFYCFYNCQEQQSTTNLLLVLLEQLLPTRPHRHSSTRLPHHTRKRFDSRPVTSPPSLFKIMESFEEVIAKYDRVFFVIDALDECGPEDRTELLKQIFRLQTGNKVHLFVTSDPNPDVERMFANTPSLEIKADQEDVRSYLERSIDALPDFVKEDPALKEDIKNTIIKAAPGSFLAVVLQLKSLAAMSSTEDLRAAFVGVARYTPSAPYDTMYEAAMSRIESQARDQAGLAKHTLAYTLCARCPWTAAELCHALMVKVGETELNWDTMPSLQAIITACSGMMVTIGHEERDEQDEQDDADNSNGDDGSDEAAMMRLIWRTNMRLDCVAVRLVHRTAHEYLQRMCERWLPERDKWMSDTCMAYLSLCYFDDGSRCYKSHLMLRQRIFPLYFYAALHWGFHARAAFDKFPDMASMDFEFLGSSTLIKASCDVMFRVGQWSRVEDHAGRYPGGMMGLHIAAHLGIANLVRALGTRAGAMVNALDEWGSTALSWATNRGHEQAVEAILEFKAIDVDIRDCRGKTPISLAARHGHTAIVKMLLDHGANPNLKDFDRATPLWHAAKEGHTTTMTLLTKCGVDVNVASTVDWIDLHTPLSLAVTNGLSEMVSLLLAQPNIQPRVRIRPSNMGKYPPCTPLGLAVRSGLSNAVDMLLSKPEIAAAARTGEDGEMLLHSAVWHGHEETVRLLLNNGADVNTRCGSGKTPLHLAVDGHNGAHVSIVRLLLSQVGVLPDLMDKDGDTPALLATSRGQIEILRFLLAKGVGTEAKTKDGLTLLGVAAEQGYLPIVELLLATDGVDAQSRDAVGRTPLILAANPLRDRCNRRSNSECVRDYGGVIQCLLNLGHVDINSRDDSGQTPLMYATRGHEDDISCFRALLGHEEVEIDAVDNKGQTALSQAVVMRKEDKTILLLETGADPNLVRFYEGETLLSYAAEYGMAALVWELISHHRIDAQGRNADGHTALCKAAANNQVQVFEVLLDVRGVDINARCSHGQTPLHHAAASLRGEEVALLLLAKGNSGLDTQDVNGSTPLHCAVTWGSEALVSSLLDAGVANANCRDLEGRTPLSLAAERGQLQVLEKFLSLKGAIPNARDNTGCTPLSWAVQSHRTNVSAVVKRMLGAEGVDPNAEDKRGWTPLSWAVQDNKASDLVELLLTEGAGRIDINHEDREGRTPLTLALKRGHEVVVGQLRAAGAREKNDEDEKQQGIEIFRVEADGAACEKEAKAQQESDGDSQSALCGDDSSTDPWEKNRWQRERIRWLSPNWFHDAPAGDDGGGDGNDRDWSGSEDRFYRRPVGPSIETQIELGAQDEVDSGDEGKEEELCPRCKALDLNRIFSSNPPGGFRAIAKLGKVDESSESRLCAMCKLLAAIRPPVDRGDCELYAHSSTATWLSRDKAAAKNYFMSNWIDTVILGVESGTSRYSASSMGLYKSPMRFEELNDSDILPEGFISRVGSNDPHRLRSITVHQLQADQADFGRARGWIACCAAHHGSRCNLPIGGPIISFRLIDCTTRDIVDGQPAINQFVALSYVWGPSARNPATVDDVRVENAERVVEDAIRATQALGYRYLWVDRHCITREDEDIRGKQLLQMNAVYANAQVTIVAAAGKDSAFGLPGVSRPRQQPYARIQGHSLVAVTPEPARSIRNSVWWTRGWTFQEGVLSRRRLIFTEHEISYECQGMVARESVELPERVHRVAATRHPIHEYARVFSHGGHGKHDDGNFSIWSQISQYTERHLTHDYDILNAMLGIMEVAAQNKSPVYHLCGVPIVLGRSDGCDGPTLLEAFARGLCWNVLCGTRREGFPSWSWTGWKGKLLRNELSAASFKFDFAIKVSMVPRGDPSGAVSWAEFEAMRPKEKAALPQDYILKIRGTAVDVSIRCEITHSPYAVFYNGNEAVKGSIQLCKDLKQDTSFQCRLAEEGLTAIVIGNGTAIGKSSILLAVVNVGDYWERIGVIKVKGEHVLDVRGGGCRKQTFLIR